MDLSENKGVKMQKEEKENTIVSEVEVDRQQWKRVGASAGSNAEPVSCLEVAEGNNIADRLYSKETE